MTSAKLKILHLEDLPSDAELVERELTKDGLPFEKKIVASKKEFIESLTNFKPDIILADHSLPSFNSQDALKIVKETNPILPFILVTATISEEFAVEIMKEGADDYILKDRLNRLPQAILHAIEKRRIEAERRKYYQELLASETQLKALNESLEKKVAQRTAELEKSNKELESFGYSVSHDLKTPLAIINTSATILEMKHGKSLNEDALKFVDKIKNHSMQMARLIDDMLLLSRLNRNTDFTREEVNMNELAKSTIDELSPNYSAKVKLTDLAPVEGNTGLLKQVWVNLISNAFKYSKEKNEPVIEIGSMPAEKQNVYYIKDNGAGFNMQKAGKLFEAFQRLHSPEEFEGTGIGLAIVHRIITNHGGRVWANGEVNVGATIYFSLPSSADDLKNKNHE